jgi:hypothetical protein
MRRDILTFKQRATYPIMYMDSRPGFGVTAFTAVDVRAITSAACVFLLKNLVSIKLVTSYVIKTPVTVTEYLNLVSVSALQLRAP